MDGKIYGAREHYRTQAIGGVVMRSIDEAMNKIRAVIEEHVEQPEPEGEKAREFWIVHSDRNTEGWIYADDHSAEKRLSSGLKAPPTEYGYRITAVREMLPGEIPLTVAQIAKAWGDHVLLRP